VKKKSAYQKNKEWGEKYRAEITSNESFSEYKKRMRRLRREGYLI
jgi:hypothetical protein